MRTRIDQRRKLMEKKKKDTASGPHGTYKTGMMVAMLFQDGAERGVHR